MDYGQGPYEDTREALDAVGISYAGEDEWYIYETDRGLKVGIYAIYNQLTGNYLDGVSEAQQQKVIEESQEMLSQALEEMKAAGAEFTIACIHMGTEGSYRPTDAQTTISHYAIDAGYQVVYGSHAHRLQPVESLQRGPDILQSGQLDLWGAHQPGRQGLRHRPDHRQAGRRHRHPGRLPSDPLPHQHHGRGQRLLPHPL